MTTAFVFPGQGSQKVGMGRTLSDAFPVAREVFDEIDDVLEQHLSRLMFQGPSEELMLTRNAQPAIMAVSLAIIKILELEANMNLRKTCKFVAGHSLGEYSALAASQAFKLGATARLLRVRGEAMQDAVPFGEGGMAAILGLDLKAVKMIASDAVANTKGEVCSAANDNAPGQVVISGTQPAVKRAMEMALNGGARRAIPLLVSAPFHCSLMKPAAKEVARTLDATVIASPSVPLISNVSARDVKEPKLICPLLIEQVTAMVRWRESVLYMANNDVDRFVEVGPGRILSGLISRIQPGLTTISLQDPEDIETFVKEY